MDLSRAVYSRDLKIAAMRALDAGSATGEIARKYQLSPNLLTRWRGEWRASIGPHRGRLKGWWVLIAAAYSIAGSLISP